jgi:D-galactarolactone cycloisomerase
VNPFEETSVDMAFTIDQVQCVRVHAPGPDYWRGFIKAADGTRHASQRFQFSPPWRTVYARDVESALVRVRLEDGTIGWGEATCPIAPEVIVTLVNGFVTELIQSQRFSSVESMVDLLYDSQRCRGYLAGHLQDSVAAVDMALHDALAKRARCSVAALFSATPATVLPCYLSGARAPTRAERVALLQQWVDTGSQAVKIFLRGSLDEDLEEFNALRHAVPALTWWAADALWTYEDAAVAARAKQAFGESDAQWLECPMLPEDLAGHIALCNNTGTAIALGEHFRTALQVAPWLAPRAVDVLQPDLGRTGFVLGRRIVAAAQAHGVAVTPHMGGALDIMQAATLQFAAAIGGPLPCEYQAGLANRIPGAIRSQWKLGTRGFEAPATFGLGVEVDEEALQAFVIA